MLRQEEGSRAVAEAVALCRPEVISAYPISPQTHIVEHLSDLVRTGDLSPCEYLMVESEFGALSAMQAPEQCRPAGDFDRAVEPETHQRDASRQESGEQGDQPFEAVPGDGEILQATGACHNARIAVD